MQRCGTCSFYFTAGLLGVLFAQEAPFIYRYIFYQYTHISGSVIQLPYGSHDLSRAYVWCVCLLALACEHRTVKQVHDQAARAWCVAGGVRMCREVCPPRWREHISRGHARRVRGLSCDREASRNFNRPGGRTLLRTDRPAGSKLLESRYAPQISSKSN